MSLMQPVRCALLSGLFLAGATRAMAQSRLVDTRSAAVSPVYEAWHFSDDILQPDRGGESRVLVKSAWQLAVPFSVGVPLGERWSVDLSGAYATARVNLAEADPALGTDHYVLSGLTDVRIRATGRLTEGVIVTLGLTAPVGRTGLDEEEFKAFRIVAAPALGFQAPTLGTGAGGTAGMVLARQLGDWAWAFGASYEVRGTYGPGFIATDVADPDFSPGNVLRLSLGTDGFVGQHGMTFALSADVYSTDRLDAQAVVPSGTTVQATETQLGPVLGASWQLRIAAPQFRELTLYATDRYRTKYRQRTDTAASAGKTSVAGSSGNYLDAGLRSVLPLSRATGLLTALGLRHQTGLDADSTLATAALVSGGLTVGLVHDLGGGYSLQPFMRGQVGRFKSAARSTSATGFGGGVTLGVRF